ncbi:MAG: hypothetical protein DBX65_01030 [Oscillospiraceae bacterium]|nr:MAG: hypothetical protein DBX65_01030 [Oscillospiraceae bacterium]
MFHLIRGGTVTRTKHCQSRMWCSSPSAMPA